MRKTLKMGLAGAAAVLVALGTALPASAATQTYYGPDGCAITLWNSTSQDRASTAGTGGYCVVDSTRHYYTVPGWGGWSRWYYGSSTLARTDALAQLSKSEHRFSIRGASYDITMLG